MQTITTFDNTAEGWERSLYAFLAEKERRSGSRRTVVGYSRMLQHFFGTVGKPPDRVTSAEVFAWGYGVGLSGKQPSSVTIGARLACLSSFYRFLIRMDIVSSNPCDALERPRVLTWTQGSTVEPFVGYPGCTANDDTCPPSQFVGGTMLLKTLKVSSDAQAANSLNTMSFGYAPRHSKLTMAIGASITFNWPHLNQADNGFGGSSLFDYSEQEQSCACSHWSRVAVQHKTAHSGLGEPDVVTTYNYNGSGPWEYDYPDPFEQPAYGSGQFGVYGYDVKNAQNRGFGLVTETTGPQGNQVVTQHWYYTTAGYQSLITYGGVTYPTGAYCCTDTGALWPASYWQAEVLNGREYITEIKDASGSTWKKMFTTWSAFNVPGSYSYQFYTPPSNPAPPTPQPFVYFIYPLQVATTLRDDSQTYVQNIYDVSTGVANPTGNLERTNQFVGTAPAWPTTTLDCSAAYGCDVSTYTPYAYDAADWLFVPRYEAKFDGNSGAMVACTRFYYDGATTTGTLYPSAGGSHPFGLVTAKSTVIAAIANAGGTATSCEPADTTITQSSNTYMQYDTHGNAVQVSVPTFMRPPDTEASPQTPGYGTIPANMPHSTTVYDTTYSAFPVQQTNALDQSVYSNLNNSFDFRWGQPTQVKEPNDHITHYTYDNFGRLKTVYDDGFDTANSPTKQINYSWGVLDTNGQLVHPNQTTVLDRVTIGGAQRSTVSCMDGFGRTVETRASYPSAQGIQFSSTRTDYDSRGNKSVLANPTSDANSGSAECPTAPLTIGSAPSSCPAATGLTGRDRTTYLYDPLGNVICTAYLSGDGSKVSASRADFNGRTSESCDEDFNTTKQVRDPSTNTRSLTVYQPSQSATSCDLTGVTTNYDATTYSYDTSARLIGVSDAAKNALGTPTPNLTSLSYDLAGRKIAMQDPDMGHWSYTYGAAGNLHTQTDARGITTTLAYDALNRITHKSYSDGEPSLTFTFDVYPVNNPCTGSTAKGHLTQSGRGAGVPYHQPCYDARGRVVSDTTFVDGQSYPVGQSYDDLGQLVGLNYPDTEQVNYCEDAAGDVTAMASTSSTCSQSLVSSAITTPWRAPSQLTLGSGQTTATGYDFRERPTSIVTGPSSCPNTLSSCSQNLTLFYDDASNVAEVKDTTSTSPEDMIYDYDQLNRLIHMHPLGSANVAVYSYDTIGNMLGKQEDCNLTLTYTPSGTGAVRPHAVSSVSSTGAGSCASGAPWMTLTYDPNGNLRQQAQVATTTSYSFDAENRLKTRTVIGGLERYTYDATGTLAKRTDASGTSTVYIGGIFEKSFDALGGATCIRKYYPFGGRSIAVNQVHVSGSGCVSGLSYLLADHLGSASTVTNSSGAVQSMQKYWPYGTTRAVSGQSSISQTDKLFTGQQQEIGDALGLYDYKARFYSTVLGRFLSSDIVAVDGLNRYGYVNDAPANHGDSSGHCISDCTTLQMLMILGCGIQGRCSDAAPTSAWQTYARWIMRQSGFGQGVRFHATVYDNFNQAVRSIRSTISSIEQSNIALDQALVTKKGPEYLPVFTLGQGHGKVTGYDVSYSYLDVIVSTYGEAKSAHSWFAEIFGVKMYEDLALQVYVGVDGSSFHAGSSSYDRGSSFSQDIEYETFYQVQMYTALRVKISLDSEIYRVDYGSNEHDESPLRTVNIPD